MLYDLETIGLGSYHLMADIWQKDKSILVANLNSDLNYLITTVCGNDPISGLVKELIGDTEKIDHRVKLFADSWYENNGDEVFAIRYGWKHTEQLTSTVYTITIQIYLY